MKGLGLKETSGKALAVSGAKFYDNVETLVSSDSDGSANIAKITAQTDANTANYSTKYPAFYWATYYRTTATNVQATDYDSGWYIPAKTEMTALLSNLTNINAILTKIGATNATTVNPSGSDNYCTSTWGNDADSYGKVYYADRTSGLATYPKNMNSTSFYVRVIRTFP